MLPPMDVLAGLDLASGAFTLAIAAFFVRVWRESRFELDLLFAAGFALLGASYLATTPTMLQAGGVANGWEYPRLAAQLGAVLVVLCAYASARVYGRPRPFLALGWAAGALSATLLALFFAIPRLATVPHLGVAYPLAHLLMAIAWTACALLSLRAWAKRRTLDHAFVPLAYAALALSKYTWLMVDLSSDRMLILIIYGWRFLALILLGLALLVPRARGEAPNAPA